MKELTDKPSPEELLDTAVELTFPASDPISIDHAFGAARAREVNPGPGKGDRKQ